MALSKLYSRIDWENEPSDKTPLNEENLNKMDSALYELDNRVITLDTTKATKIEISELFSGVEFNESTGVITFIRKNGSRITIDTKLEKLAINFSYNPAKEQLVITLDDGTKQYVDLSALVTVYEFLDSDTITFVIEGGKVKANIKKNSITGDMLEPNYLANVTIQANTATQKANEAYASAEVSKNYADLAEQSAATAGWGAFDINESGHLIFYKTENNLVDFKLNNGRLEVTI